MISTLSLSIRSMWNRRTASLLTVGSIALSVCLLLSIERIRLGVKNSFEQNLSGMDLVVGPRGGSLQVLLYSVFRIGSPSNNVEWETYEEISSHPEVAWSIPLSMGDSHKGFPVVGTDERYFQHFLVNKKPLTFREGHAFTISDDEALNFEAVIGSEIARKLNYQLGQKLILSHGMGDSFHTHDETPVVVVGILNPTGSPADRTIHVHLDSLDEMHHEHEEGEEHEHHHEESHEHHHDHDHDGEEETFQPISAFLVGLKNKQGILSFQRMVNEYEEEPIMAIVPGLTFMELWSMLSTTDTALMLVSLFVLIAVILGILASLLTTLESRSREISILRALGARPSTIFSLFLNEGLLLALTGYILGFILVYPLLYSVQPILLERFGFYMQIEWLTGYDAILFVSLFLLSFLAGLIPAIKAYRRSLAEGLISKV